MKNEMTLKTVLLLLVFCIPEFSSLAWAGNEGMVSMPKIAPKKTFQVKDADALSEGAGFGKNEAQVKMMNLMMVEGSGMEGMDMHEMKMPESRSQHYQISLNKSGETAQLGANLIRFQIKDTESKAVLGLKLRVEVFMTSMDMGTQKPAVKELSSGNYEVKAEFSMEGPWALKVTFPNGESWAIPYSVKTK